MAREFKVGDVVIVVGNSIRHTFGLIHYLKLFQPCIIVRDPFKSIIENDKEIYLKGIACDSDTEAIYQYVRIEHIRPLL